MRFSASRSAYVTQERQGSTEPHNCLIGGADFYNKIGIEQTNAVLLPRPIDADKPMKLFTHPIHLPSAAGHRDARRSLYWRSRRKPPTGRSIAAILPGRLSSPGARGTGGRGGSRQIGPSDQHTMQIGYDAKMVQGGRRRRPGGVVSHFSEIIAAQLRGESPTR